MPPRSVGPFGRGAVLAAALSLAGCQASPCDVSGRVTLNERPVVIGSVVLFAKSGQPVVAPLDGDGRYALLIFAADRPKFASGDKAQGSAQEYRAAATGSNAHFGRFAADATAGVVTFNIERASFPNWEGTSQRRDYVRTGDTLRYTVPVTTTPGAVGEVTWRRLP